MVFKFKYLFLFLFFFSYPSWAQYALEKVVEGFSYPTDMAEIPDGSSRYVVLEQAGVIKVFKDKKILKELFLDISEKVESGGEKGLLGIAFHPDFKKNKKFYLNYTTRKEGKLYTVISKWQLGEKNLADKKSEKIILTFEQPYDNHNGGQLAFGPDGYFYMGVGDGGGAGDPKNNGQNLKTILGSILRIDVNGKEPYEIPKDNPFVDHQEARKEIWAYGLRNPWRFSFDSETGTLYAGDVGQVRREEIDVIQKGKNYGWRIMEGTLCYKPSEDCKKEGLELPLVEYGRDEGYSVTGGFVYRGKKLQELIGHYIYADFGTGKMWALKYDGKKASKPQLVNHSHLKIASFSQDHEGELYIIHYGGAVYRLISLLYLPK
ncbi:MAG: PQQ-dependent sugar dehydrogenase [Deltaproteobacteria bacterium]|nr:PQQ-dependent sugar dehydrogenase [Deltaproteobacteria bacterium]